TPAASVAPRDTTSSRSSSSSPRGAVAKKASERLEDNQDHRGEEEEHRHFVEPAEPDVAAAVALLAEVDEQPVAPDVVGDRERDDEELGVQPTAGALKPAAPQPQAEGDGEHRAGG